MGTLDSLVSGSSGFTVRKRPVVTTVATSASPTKEHHGFGGFLHNLGSDARDLAGVLGGLKMIGSAGIHDVGKTLHLTSGPYQTDDLAKSALRASFGPGSVLGETALTQKALFTGDKNWDKHAARANKAIYNHPLNSALDLLGAYTGGGAVVGKTSAKIAAETGSRTAMDLAGLRRATEITPSTVRGIKGKAGIFEADTQKIIDPLTGKTLHEYPVARNSSIRGRQALKEAMYSKLPDTNYFAPTRRGARLTEKTAGRQARREAGNIDHNYLTAYSKLSPDERDALFYISQGFNTVDRAKQLIAYRAERAQSKLENHAAGVADAMNHKKGSASKAAKASADAHELLTDAKVVEKVLPHIENPSEHLVAALKAQRIANDATQAAFKRSLIRGGLSGEEADQLIIQRARMPLRRVGIIPDKGEVPMTITHVVKSDAKKGHGVEQAFERGLNAKQVLAEERKSSGSNWMNARYDRNAASVLNTHRVMFAKEQTHERLARAMSKAVPYTKNLHKDVLSGKLHHITKNDKLIKDMQYVDQSLDRVEKSLPDIDDHELEQLRDAYGAMHDLIHAEGSPGMVIPKAHYDELVKQFAGGKNILAELVAKPTTLWKHIVLSYKGSYYTNNFIGNALLGSVAYGPRYLLDTARETLPGKLRGNLSHRIDAEMSDLSRTNSAHSMLDSKKAAKYDIISRGGEFLASKGALFTENNFRRAAVRANLRAMDKEFKKARPGLSRGERLDAIFNDKRAVDRLAEQTYGDLLDYSKMTPLEREWVIPFLPFWSFTRSMTGRTIRLTLDEPWKMRVLLYAGNKGVEANQELMPKGVDLPTYLSGLVLLDKTGDLPRIMSTAGSNPFTAPMDLISQITSMGGGGDSPNLLSSFNPIFKAPLEAGMNRDFFTGQDVIAADGSTPNGFLGRLKVQTLKNIPQLASYQRYHHPSKYPAVERSGKDYLMQYLGAPVGDLNSQNVAQIQAIQASYDARAKAAEAARKRSAKERAR